METTNINISTLTEQEYFSFFLQTLSTAGQMSDKANKMQKNITKDKADYADIDRFQNQHKMCIEQEMAGKTPIHKLKAMRQRKRDKGMVHHSTIMRV